MRNWWRHLWPTITNYEEAKLVARTYGAYVSAYLAFSWVTMLVQHFFYYESPKDTVEFLVVIIFYLIPTFLFLWLMRRIWNRKIVIVPFILVWFVGQIATNHIISPGQGWAITLIITLFAIAALRGWWAVRKYDRASR